MKTHTIAGIGLTALIMAGFAAGETTVAGKRDEAAIVKDANESAAKAAKALGKGDAHRAVGLAEAAVVLQPQDAGFRLLLGQSYLKAGRFTSAHQAFADVLTLNPGDGKAALNMALAQIAQGQWDAARQTLDAHRSQIPARDRGLAIALAGDPAGGIAVLMDAARSPESDAKTRQNLALAFALAGRWREARTVVSVDVSPAETDQRLMQWAAFAKPSSASDQVAALLGVVPVKDAGQPVTLALNATVAVAAVDPVETYMPGQAVDTVPPVEVASAPVVEAPVAVAAAVSTSISRGIVFGERREIVQALPATASRAKEAKVRTIASKGAFKTRVAAVAAPAAKQPAKGNWYVQLGAFDNAGVAKDAWARATRRYAALAGQSPAGMAFKGRGQDFYRLSVGGFARADAAALCRGYRAKGGACFVRLGAGDQVASWTKPARVQFASR